jgi:hypothetical protein
VYLTPRLYRSEKDETVANLVVQAGNVKAAEQEVSLAHAMLVSVMRFWTARGGEEESDEDGNVDGSDTE